jgi:hypothetical protein
MNTVALGLTVVSLVTGKVCLLVSLWLRLRWRTRHEQVQRQHLASMTQSIAQGSHVEVVERRPDGHSVRIKITRSTGKTTTA